MYIISPITVFDEENELFETKIGLNNKEMTLLFSAWGDTAQKSRVMAEKLVKILTDILVKYNDK